MSDTRARSRRRPSETRSRLRCTKATAALALVATLLLLGQQALAAPEAHLLRIDPRASVDDNDPVLTTVIELVQHKPMSDLTARCAAFTGNAELGCLAEQLEKPKALYQNVKFPEGNALFMTTVDGRDQPASLVSMEKWGVAKKAKQKGVGTAWLLMIDASGGMGSRFEESKRIAKAFINQAGPSDIIDIMFFNDRSVVRHSKWQANKGLAINFVDGVPTTFPKQGRSKALFSIVQQGVTDAFTELGNVGNKVEVPLHQTMVLISDGNSGTDVSSAAPTVLKLREFLTKGRFPEDNTTLPRAPLPAISIWLPNRATEEVFQNARQFMENLANPEIGGAFFVVQDGEGNKGDRLAQVVNTRFDDMFIAKWRVPCLAPQVSQTFKLVFKNTDPVITGDNCVDCPLGVDPTQWPLAIDYEATEKAAKKDRVHPGGSVKIFGSFCWGTSYERAELYLLPKNQPAPTSLKGKSIDEAQQAQQTLIRDGLKGKAVDGGDNFVEFDVPDTTKFLAGKGKSMTARLIVVDSFVKRTSPVLEERILTLAAEDKPLNLLLIGGLTFGGVILVLLVVSLLRGGGGAKSRRRGGGTAPAPPRPVVGGMGPAPAPSPGFGAPVPGAPLPGGAPPAYGAGPPMPGPGGHPGPGVPRNATLQSALGVYHVSEGRETKVGRDPGLCDICLSEPRISGMHATLKLEGGQLFVRDEGSNNGTAVGGVRIQSFGWVPVPAGGTVKFGPIEFTVRFE